MAQPRVYLETSVISYLAARPIRDEVKRAKQVVTREWWAANKAAYRFYISDAVIEEIRLGDADAARQRLALVSGLPLLAVTPSVRKLHSLFFSLAILPAKANVDALHIALAAVHGIEYLVTWNCKHINNAMLRRAIDLALENAGYDTVVMATPEELWRPAK